MRFLIVMGGLGNDWTVGHGENGVNRKFTCKLDDLDFSDDVVLISSTKQQIQDKTARMDDQNQTSWIKSQHGEDKGDDNYCKEPGVDYDSWTRNRPDETSLIMIAGQGIAEVDEFTYLESTGGRREVV